MIRAFVFCSLFVACTSEAAKPQPPATATFVTAMGEPQVTLEVALSSAERQKGLM